MTQPVLLQVALPFPEGSSSLELSFPEKREGPGAVESLTLAVREWGSLKTALTSAAVIAFRKADMRMRSSC